MSPSDTPFKVLVQGYEPIGVLAAEAFALDMIPTGPGKGHILKDQKSYTYEIVSTDFVKKTFIIRINGNLYTVNIDDRYDQLIAQMGLSSEVVHKVKDIKAPMPGLVLDLLVVPGQQVSQGEKILILEAMKMENVIKSPGDCIVKAVFVQKGDSVEKGHLMVEME